MSISSSVARPCDVEVRCAHDRCRDRRACRRGGGSRARCRRRAARSRCADELLDQGQRGGARVVLPQRPDDLRAPVARRRRCSTSRIGPPIPARCTRRGDPVRLAADQHLDAVRPAALRELDGVEQHERVGAGELVEEPEPREEVRLVDRDDVRPRPSASPRSARPSISTVSGGPGSSRNPVFAYTARAGGVGREHVQRHAAQAELAERVPQQQLDRLAAVPAALLVGARRCGSAAPPCAPGSIECSWQDPISSSPSIRPDAEDAHVARARGSRRTRRRGRRARPGGTARWRPPARGR